MARLIQLSNTSWKQPFKDRKKELPLWGSHPEVASFCGFKDGTKRLLNIKFEKQFGIDVTRSFQITSGNEISFPKDFQDRVGKIIFKNPESFFTVTVLDTSHLAFTPSDIIWIKNVTKKRGEHAYMLIQFWQTLLKNPSGEKSMDDFAMAIDKIPKIVYSHTLKNTEWDSAKLSSQPIENEVLELKQQSGKDIFVGSRSLIIQLMNRNLIDEFQICIHPVLEGKGLPLFDKIKDRTIFKLFKTKTLGSGAIVLYYEPARQ